MPAIEVRCADESCAYHEHGFPEDGFGGAVDAMSRHRRETGHSADGLYVDGERVVTGNRQSKMYLQNHRLLQRREDPEGGDPQTDPWPEGGGGGGGGVPPDGALGDDGEDEDDDDEEDEDDPRDRRTSRRPVGRPATPDLTRGYIAARDIPIGDEVARLFSSHLAYFADLYRQDLPDDAPEDAIPAPLPYAQAMARWIADIAVHDLTTRPDRYPLARQIEDRAYELIRNTHQAQEAKWRELEAWQRQLDQRGREIQDREAALARGGAPRGG